VPSSKLSWPGAPGRLVAVLLLFVLGACANGIGGESPRFRTLEEMRTRQQADTLRRADAAAAAGPSAGLVVALAPPSDTARSAPRPDAPPSAGNRTSRPAAGEQGKWIRAGTNPPNIDLQVFESPIADVASYISHRVGVDIVVSSDPSVRSALLTGEIKGRPWHLAFEALLEAHGLRALQAPSGIITVVSAAEAAQGRQPELIELQFRDASDVVAALRPIFRGAGADSAAAGNVEVLGDSETSRTLVVYGSPDQVASVRALVSQYDRRPANVTIEARLVLVNTQAMQKRGVQYSFNTLVNDSTGGQSTGVTLSGAGAANLPGISGSAFTLRRRFGNTPIGVNVFIDALTSEGWAETETRPLVMTTSEREGRINVGDSYILPVPQPILATGGVLVPGGQNPGAGGDSTGGGYPTGGAGTPGAGAMLGGGGGFAQFLTGTTLRVTPIVLDGGRQVRLKVDLVRDGGTLGPDGRSITGGRNSTTTEVIVDDNAPVVIGSFTVQGRSSASSGVPVLRDLPLLGRVFRHDEESSNYMDLVIVLIPHIHPAPERSAP
jgi:Flp pilus assembly secretin CpaC